MIARTSPFQLWWDENMQGYAVSPEILKLMAMAFEGGQDSLLTSVTDESNQVKSATPYNVLDHIAMLDDKSGFAFYDPPQGAFIGSIDMIKWLVKNKSNDYWVMKAELKTVGDIWNR
jgi:hypothetical protein